MKVLGVQVFSFSNQAGQLIEGVKVHGCDLPENPNGFRGQAVYVETCMKSQNEELYKRLSALDIATEIVPVYNRQGKLADFKLIK